MLVLGRDFGKWLGREDGALRSEGSALVKDAPESSPALSPKRGRSERTPVMNQKVGFRQSLIIWVPRSWACSLQNCEDYTSVKPPDLWHFAQQPEWTKTVVRSLGPGVRQACVRIPGLLPTSYLALGNELLCSIIHSTNKWGQYVLGRLWSTGYRVEKKIGNNLCP